MDRGSPQGAPGEPRGWREPGLGGGMGEAWAREARGGWRARVRRPASCKGPRGPWGRDGRESVAGLASSWADSLPPALLLTFGPSKSNGGSKRQGGDLGPREAPSRVRAETPCHSLGAGWDSAFSKGPCAPHTGQACPQHGDQMGCDLEFVGRDTGQAQTLGCPGVRAHISGHSSQTSYDPPTIQLWVSWCPPGSSVSPLPAPAGNTLSRALHVLFPLRTVSAGGRVWGPPVSPLCLQQPPSECPWGSRCPGLP